MKSTLVLLASFIFFMYTHAAIQEPKIKNAIDTLMCTAHDTTVFYNNVEKSACFQGGDLQKFRIFIAMQIRYPVEAQMKNYQGRVYIRFIVDWDGKVKNVAVHKTSGYKILDEEALRVVRKSPDWIPAKNNSICVAQQFVIPVLFNSLGIINK
jgi:TonB family protein